MTGVLFGLVRGTIAKEYGEEFWGSIAEAGRCNGRGRNGVSAPSTDLPSDSLICWLGRQAIPSLAGTYPSLFSKHRTVRSFVRSLNDAVPTGNGPPEGAMDASLAFHDSLDGDLLVTVDGPVGCCAIVKGVIAGAGDQYGEAVSIEELKCSQAGDNRCVLRLRFGLPSAAGWDVSSSRAAASG